MKKFYNVAAIFVFTLIMVLSFAGCSQIYSAESAESGLKKSGYSVSVYTAVEFEQQGSNGALETSKMEGLQTVIYAEKRDSSNKITSMGLILVFDSISSAQSVSDSDEGLLYSFAKNYVMAVNYGQYNNVVFSGSSEARLAAGITSIAD